MTKLLCIIPARSGSRGLKHKNVQKLRGIPLLKYPYYISKRIKFINDTVLTSDAKGYLDLIKDKKIIKILRPKKYAKSNSKIIDVIKHTLKELKQKYDYLLLLEPTSPFTDYKEIENAYKILLKKKSIYDFAVSIVSLPKYNSAFSIKADSFKKKLNFPKNTNRQFQKKEFFISGNFYLAKISRLISNGGFISRRTFGFEIKKSIHLDIDTKIDLLLTKAIIKNGLFKKIK